MVEDVLHQVAFRRCGRVAGTAEDRALRAVVVLEVGGDVVPAQPVQAAHTAAHRCPVRRLVAGVRPVPVIASTFWLGGSPWLTVLSSRAYPSLLRRIQSLLRARRRSCSVCLVSMSTMRCFCSAVCLASLVLSPANLESGGFGWAGLWVASTSSSQTPDSPGVIVLDVAYHPVAVLVLRELHPAVMPESTSLR